MVLFLAYTGLRWGEMAALEGWPGRLPPPARAGRRIGDPVKGVMTWGRRRATSAARCRPPFLIEELSATSGTSR